MLFTKQNFYETDAKFAKLLARKLQKQKADIIFYKIRDPMTKNLVYKKGRNPNSLSKILQTTIYPIAARGETKY